MRVLIIDDSRAMRSMLALIMKDLGFESETAAHGGEALALLQRDAAFDLALIDWNMPEVNGYELLVAMRRDPIYTGIRCIMVTTETEVSQMLKALDAGADEYIMKPFTRDIMREKLQVLGLVAA